jgi:polysaccharide pyruvyl transferase WcaK-like protein
MTDQFLLYGISGIYNYGCEAIVRSTVTLLREAWPTADIRYASLRWKDDARRLGDCDVKLVRRMRWPFSIAPDSRLSGWRVLSMLRRGMGIKWNPILECQSQVQQCSAALSVGGDIYTAGLTGKGYPKDLVAFGNYVMSEGKRFVIWGASIGPFDKDATAEKAIVEQLLKTDLITSRDPVSTAYLKSRGIVKNVVQCADPSFALSWGSAVHCLGRSRPTIGINLSPLSLRHVTPDTGLTIAASTHARTIATIVRHFDANVVLIPHVICDFTVLDDDLRYLRRVNAQLPKEIRSRVDIVENDPGYLGLRTVLRQCDLVIAARMHCAINALSGAIPAVLLAYSAKAIGMSQYIYGDRRWLIPAGNFTPDQAIPMLSAMLAEKEQLSAYLFAQRNRFRSQAQNAVTSLRALLQSETVSAPKYLTSK